MRNVCDQRAAPYSSASSSRPRGSLVMRHEPCPVRVKNGPEAMSALSPLSPQEQTCRFDGDGQRWWSPITPSNHQTKSYPRKLP
jgi:hypothetical protein